MQPEHRIDELIVDLSFTTTRLARREKTLLTKWLGEELLPALDQLFSRYSPGQQILRFETVEFNFGNLTSRNYQQRIREQLLEKFAQLLQTQLLAVAPGYSRLPVPANERDNDGRSTLVALTQLFNYLSTGQLAAHCPFDPIKHVAADSRTINDTVDKNTTTNNSPARHHVVNNNQTQSDLTEQHAGAGDVHKTRAIKNRDVVQAALHEQLLEAVIAQQNIADLLRELPQREMLIQRLLTQFSVTQRLELVRQLAPQYVHHLLAFLDLLQFFDSNTFYADPAFSGTSLESFSSSNNRALLDTVVWQATLQLGLENPQANEAFWLTDIISKLANALAISKKQLQQYLIAINIAASPAAAPLVNLQTQIARIPLSENTVNNSRISAPSSYHETDIQDDAQRKSRDDWRRLIANAFIRADASQLQQRWSQLTANEPHLLLAALAHYLSQAEIRQQVMMRFPLVLQADIIAVLAPPLNALFMRLQKNAAQLMTLISRSENGPAGFYLAMEKPGSSGNTSNLNQTSTELLQRHLWEIALGLLLKNQSTSADTDYRQHSELFLMALAEGYANLHAYDVNAVQQAWCSLLLDKRHDIFSADPPNDKLRNEGESHVNGAALYQTQLLAVVPYSPTTAAGNAVEKIHAELINNNLLKLRLNEKDSSDNHATSGDQIKVNQATINQVIINQSNGGPADTNLVSISDHQLFDLCLRLKSGAQAWSSLSPDVRLMQRLIRSYIRLGHSATAENCADFVAAIDAQAQSMPFAANFYREVLQSLIADKLIDLDAIALRVGKNVRRPGVYNVLPMLDEQEAGSSGDVLISPPLNTWPLDVIAMQLHQGKIKPEGLALGDDQFVQLINVVIKTSGAITQDTQADLITAIHQHAQYTNRRTDFYQRVLTTLVRKELVDLMLICMQVNEQQASDAIMHNQSSDNLTHTIDKQNPRLSSAHLALVDAGSLLTSLELRSNAVTINSHNNTSLIPEVNAPATSITITNDIATIAQSLLTKPHSLTSLQYWRLDVAQWHHLTVDVIQQSQLTDAHLAAEWIDAIQVQARRAITPAVYYRLVIEAILQQQPIDLEAFAATAEEEQQVSIQNSSTQSPANHAAVENKAANASDVADHPHVNPDQAIDYPLSTGSDNFLHTPPLSLVQLLVADLPLSQEQLLALQQHVNRLLNHPNQVLIAEWSGLLARAQCALVLIHSVPAHLLHQIAMRLQTSRYTWLDAMVKVVMEALALLVTDINSLTIKQAKWEFILHYLFASGNSSNHVAENNARATELSIELCEQLARAAGIADVQRLVNLAQRRVALLKPPAQQKPAMRLQDITTNPATHSDANTPQWEAGLHINNAGQVLAAAFLPRLFSMLNLMQDGKFIHPGAADRAVHLVQFMVTGQSATPEYELVLNKILCGIGTSIPVSAGIDITEQEQTLIEQMLNSMIQHWKVLGSTSITGLRETFFQRQGWLILEEDCWRLKVKEQTFDLLLDRLPWSISLIKHGWMDKPLRVSWRNQS